MTPLPPPSSHPRDDLVAQHVMGLIRFNAEGGDTDTFLWCRAGGVSLAKAEQFLPTQDRNHLKQVLLRMKSLGWKAQIDEHPSTDYQVCMVHDGRRVTATACACTLGDAVCLAALAAVSIPFNRLEQSARPLLLGEMKLGHDDRRRRRQDMADRFRGGETVEQLAEAYGVCRETVINACKENRQEGDRPVCRKYKKRRRELEVAA
jgi:hypothetical protein